MKDIAKNYLTIQGWMTKDLQLSGNELLAFSLIYGFSQDGYNKFTGSLKYVCQWLNCTKPTAITVLSNLVSKKLLIKEEITINSVKFNTYKADLDEIDKILLGGKEILPGGKEILPGGKEILPGGKEILPGGKNFLPNNIEYNIDNNIEYNNNNNIKNIYNYKKIQESNCIGKEHAQAHVQKKEEETTTNETISETEQPTPPQRLPQDVKQFQNASEKVNYYLKNKSISLTDSGYKEVLALDDDIFRQYLVYFNTGTKLTFEGTIDIFLESIKLQRQEHQNFYEFRRHFLNWIPKHSERVKKKHKEGNARKIRRLN